MIGSAERWGAGTPDGAATIRRVPPADDALRRIDTLIQVAMRIATSAPSGRVALAKLASALEPEWVPRPWGDGIWDQLQAAREAALEPVPAREIERILRDAWDARPTDELDELDTEPAATTPTSQVHRGVLDGEPVAVKVLRPGLAAGVRQDLALLEGLLSPLSSAFPQLDAKAVMRELRERVLDELDLEHEAGMQRRFHRALRRREDLVVPAPVTRLASDSVLVSEWVDGTPLAESGEGQRDGAAARLILFVLGGLREGVVHADADPADVLVLADGRVAVLDYGATRTVDPDRADSALAAVEAFAAGDGKALGAALEQLGALGATEGPQALELARHVLGELGEPAPSRLDSRALVGAARRVAERPEQALQLLLAASLPPEDLWSARAIAQLFGTIARAGATAPWRELTQRALREGWATEVG
jgi:predicted unusual protein kinase regulating ubiquinone biosynthesis (AarF/ABC1/UbiB family)